MKAYLMRCKNEGMGYVTTFSTVCIKEAEGGDQAMNSSSHSKGFRQASVSASTLLKVDSAFEADNKWAGQSTPIRTPGLTQAACVDPTL